MSIDPLACRLQPSCPRGPTITNVRLAAVEYDMDGLPAVVIVEESWDHSKQPWFRPGRDRPTGLCRQDWTFEYSRCRGGLFYRNVGMGGGAVEKYNVYKFVQPKPPKSKLWLANGVQAVAWKSDRRPKVPVSDAELLRRGYQRIPDLLDLANLIDSDVPVTDPFAVAEECSEIVRCDRCRDCFPDPGDDWRDPCPHIWFCEECGAAGTGGRKRTEHGNLRGRIPVRRGRRRRRPLPGTPPYSRR